MNDIMPWLWRISVSIGLICIVAMLDLMGESVAQRTEYGITIVCMEGQRAILIDKHTATCAVPSER